MHHFRNHHRLWLALLIAFMCNFLPHLLTTSLAAQSSASSLELSPKQLDVGIVGHGQKKTLEFQVINLTREPIQLSKIRPTCGCMKMKPHDVRTPLGPGEKRTFRFELSLGRGWGSFSKKIEVHVGNQAVLRLPVIASHHPGIRTSRRELVLSTSTVAEIAEATQVVEFEQISANQAPTITDLNSSDSMFRVRLLEPVKNRARVEVTARQGSTTDRFVGQIHGLCNGLPFTVPIRGRAFGLVLYQPQAWNLNQVKQAGFSDSVLTLRRVDGKPLKVTDTQLDLIRNTSGVELSFTTKSLADGTVQILAFVAEPFPSTAGGIYGKLKVTLDIEDPKPLVIDLLGVVRAGRR
jgi:hypothetical protein